MTDLVAAMNGATEEAKKAVGVFNQAVITGQHAPDLDVHSADVARAMRRLEAATLRVARELLR